MLDPGSFWIAVLWSTGMALYTVAVAFAGSKNVANSWRVKLDIRGYLDNHKSALTKRKRKKEKMARLKKRLDFSCNFRPISRRKIHVVIVVQFQLILKNSNLYSESFFLCVVRNDFFFFYPMTYQSAIVYIEKCRTFVSYCVTLMPIIFKIHFLRNIEERIKNRDVFGIGIGIGSVRIFLLILS